MFQWLRIRRADSVLRKARRLIAEGEPRAAIPLGERLLEMKHTGGFEVLALAHQAIGDSKEAVAVAQRGNEAAPGAWLLWQLLGNLLDTAGRSDEALDAYDRAATCSGAVPAAVEYNRSLALSHLRRFEEAFRAVEVACKAEPGEELLPLAVAQAVDCLLELARGSEAVAFAQAAAAALASDSPLRAQLLSELGWAMLKGGHDQVGARQVLAQVIEQGGRGDRWLQLSRHLQPRPLDAGSIYRLMLRGRSEAAVRGEAPLGFYVSMKVAAADEATAFRHAAQVMPEAVRGSLSMESVERLGAAEAGTLAGVCWYPGGRTFFPEDAPTKGAAE